MEKIRNFHYHILLFGPIIWTTKTPGNASVEVRARKVKVCMNVIHG